MDDANDMRSAERRLAAIIFADVPSFTRLSAENEPEALRLLGVLQAFAREIVADHGGTIVKFMGDGLLAEFVSTDPAAEAALRLQMRIAKETREWDSGPHQLRVGLHLGDVTVGPDGDIFGDGVNRASRLEGLAEPGQLLISEDVWRQLRRRPDFRFNDGGKHEVRNVPEMMQVYTVHPSDALAAELSSRVTKPTPSAKPKSPAPRRTNKKAVAVGMSAGLAAFISLIVWSAFNPVPVDLRQHEGVLSVAVLPFSVQGDQAEENVYLGQGIAEDLIHALSAVEGIRVSSRRSSFVYQASSSLSTQAIADKLGVFVLVAGNVRPAGPNSMTISAEAVDADHDEQVGSATWTGPAAEIASGQEQVIAELIATLGEIYAFAGDGSEDQGLDRPTIPPAAYEALQRGRHALQNGRYREAVLQLETAGTLAPTVGPIKIALAEAVIGAADRGGGPVVGAGRRATALLREAAALEEDSEVHAALASVLARFQWDWTGAEEEYRKALALNPTTVIRRQYAEFLASRGRFAQAHDQVATSIREEPGSVQGVTSRGIVFFRAGEYDQARVLLEMAVQLDPADLAARIHLARAQGQLGGHKAAAATLQDVDAPLARAWRLQLGLAAGARPGPRELSELDARLEEALGQGGDSPYVTAAIRMANGQARPMVVALQRGIEARSPSLRWLASDPIWEGARGNARFEELVSRIEGR